MPSAKFFIADDTGGPEPITITIEQTQDLTGESRSQVYNHLALGHYVAVKSGRRTLIIYESIKAYFAALPRAMIKPPRPRAMHHARK